MSSCLPDPLFAPDSQLVGLWGCELWELEGESSPSGYRRLKQTIEHPRP